ncbi:GLPGLI family protein [Luteirhabdus pelagi]|uniref:GLPGLI family protein n=1 Tax=Luteirhabdus pelagi TaxID=2792783 RepID=UPI0019393EB6|nr:GLPGLI family protein [Luteirhabdus pelagi]
MRTFFLTITLLSYLFSISQNISGKAEYQSKTTIDMDNFGGSEMSEQMKQQIAERMKSMLEKTFILTFNANESIYKEEEKLETGGGRGFGMMMNSFSAGPQYKNLKENVLLEEREFFGKQFLIKDTLNGLNWEIGKESKQIGQYLAIKATATKEIDENDFSMARRRNRDRDEGEKEADSTKTESDDPMDQIEVPKQILVTAWFTPQIPVGNGPGEYGGLPGLILELNAYRTTILCTKIVMNPSEMDAIEPLTKGEEVSRSEYNAIIAEKIKEMRENFRNRGGRRGRN